MGTRMTVDFGDLRLVRLLKMEAQDRDTSVKEVIIQAIETYFFHRLETKALQKASEAVFSEWNNPLDAEYDSI